MMSNWFFILCEIAVIASALVSGVFLTFSDFVMRSLGGAQTSSGVEVMQGINRDVFRSVFIVLLLGMSALSPILMGFAYSRVDGPAFVAVMIGGALYIAGVFGVTLVFNVPMNDRLAAQSHSSPKVAAYWTGTYLPRWTFWNTVRAVSSAGTAVCFLMASLWLAQGAVAAG